MDKPSLLVPLVAPVITVVAASVSWLLLAFSPRVRATLELPWLLWALLVAQLFCAVMAWLVIRNAPHSAGNPGCITSESSAMSLAWILLLAAIGIGGVAIMKALFAEERPAALERLGLWSLALAGPYAIAFVIVPEAFCGWN